jgi:hypothetical protein
LSLPVAKLLFVAKNTFFGIAIPVDVQRKLDELEYCFVESEEDSIPKQLNITKNIFVSPLKTPSKSKSSKMAPSNINNHVFQLFLDDEGYNPTGVTVLLAHEAEAGAGKNKVVGKYVRRGAKKLGS